MKKILAWIFIAICILSICACTNDTVINRETEICAFVKEIRDDVIIIDIAEYVTSKDKERVSELKLTSFDMPNGYYIHNPEIESQEFTLTQETMYNFIDWNNDFVQKGENREISTTNKDGFIKYLSTYENSQPNMPFFFKISGTEVISITEKPMM